MKRGFHSMSLIETFLLEVSFPQVEVGWATLKNESVSQLPDLPSCNDESFYNTLKFTFKTVHFSSIIFRFEKNYLLYLKLTVGSKFICCIHAGA